MWHCRKCLHMSILLDTAFAQTANRHPGTRHATAKPCALSMLQVYCLGSKIGVMICSAATQTQTGVGGTYVALAFKQDFTSWCLVKLARPTIPLHLRHCTFCFCLSLKASPSRVTWWLYAAVEFRSLCTPPFITMNFVFLTFTPSCCVRCEAVNNSNSQWYR